MALCTLCASIPFDELPSFPWPAGYTRVTNHEDTPELVYGDIWHDGSDPETPKDPLGFPYHENLDGLAESAMTCPLCSIVQAGTLRWRELYNKALQTQPYFIEFGQQQRQPIPEGVRLWLTRRPFDSGGFVVLARNARRQDHDKDLVGVYLLTGVSFSVNSDSPLAYKFPLRPVEADAGSSTCLDTVKLWLENCMENHKQTTPPGRTILDEQRSTREWLGTKDPPLPTRVLDINSHGEMVQLVDGAGLSGRYACLSYCWGTSKAFTLTRESMVTRKSGFAVSELPQTVHDAVLVARHLCLPYLWVDSLCICQDDMDDWAQQSANMSDIYSNAHIVIAANHANDKSVGCFNQREKRPTALIEYPGLGDVYAQMLFPGHENGEVSFKSEPLSQRGWALQERILSRRIIHYNTRQIYFECDHGIFGEDGCGQNSRYCRNVPALDAYPLRDLFLWNSILLAYGLRKLSKRTDKLPAMSGLASIFQKRFQTQYVAGLWGHELIKGLGWQGHTPDKPSSFEYIGPSWSWAGLDGAAANNIRGDCIDIAKALDWHTELKERANPYGEVKDAWIRIHAPITRLFPSKKETTDLEIKIRRAGGIPNPRFCTKYSHDEEGSMLDLDYGDDKKSREWSKWEMHVGLLRETIIKRSNDNNELSDDTSFFGLVVRRVQSGQEEQFQRVGCIDLEACEGAELRDDHQSWATIKLV